MGGETGSSPTGNEPNSSRDDADRAKTGNTSRDSSQEPIRVSSHCGSDNGTDGNFTTNTKTTTDTAENESKTLDQQLATLTINDTDEREEWEMSDTEEDTGMQATTTKASIVPLASPMDDEPTVALDCSDFPSSFKTHHIRDIFREFESMQGGYRVKWINDTRAIIIFEHPSVAKKAYIANISNPLAKIQPYRGPLDFAKPTRVPQRPTTSAMVAQRLVHGALGMRAPAKSKEQRDAERKMLQEAREAKNAARRLNEKRVQGPRDAFDE